MGLLSAILWLPFVMEILKFWVSKTGPFTSSQLFADGIDYLVGQLRALDLASGAS